MLNFCQNLHRCKLRILATLIAFACAVAGAERSGLGADFQVTVENKSRQVVTVNRVYAGSDRHAAKDMQPGERLNLTLPADSDQVFIVWFRGKILGEPIKFSPAMFDRIGITIDLNMRVTTQVAARQ